ncbi:MAG: hypothetical protein ACO3QQ_03035 [Candidatus Nanopelagicaceae bacterium]
MKFNEKSAIYSFANEMADYILSEIWSDKKLSQDHFDEYYNKVSEVNGGAAWDRAFTKLKHSKDSGIQSLIKKYQNFDENHDYLNDYVEPVVNKVCYERWLEGK